MATDLSTLEIVITERGAEATQRALDGVAQSSENAERATSNLARAQVDHAAGSQQMAQSARALSQAQQELVARAERLAASAASVDAANDQAVASYTAEAVAIRGVASELRSLNLVEDALQRGGATVDANRSTMAVRAAEVEAYAEAATRAGVASGATAAAVASVEGAATKAAAGSGLLSRALAGIASVSGIASTGVSGLAGSLAGMVVGGAVITGVIAGINAVVGVYRELTKSEREAKEAADAFKQSDAGVAARARAQAQEAAISGTRAFEGGLLTPKIDVSGATKEINAALAAERDLRAELAKPISINLDFGDNLNPLRLRAFNQQVGELQKQFAAGRISADAFEHGLSELDRAFPGFERQILLARQLGSEYDEAAKAVRRLQSAEANRQAESRAVISTFGQPGTSFEQGGDAAVRLAEQRRALAQAQQEAAAASARGTFGVEDIRNQSAALEQATASWKDYVVATGNAALANTSYAQALSNHNAVAVEFLKNAQAQIAANQQVARTLAVQADVSRGTGELEKLRALNGAYRESALVQQVLGIQIDATNQKRQNALQYQGADLAALNALADATARERIQQVLRNDQLEREARLRASRNENAGALEAAVDVRNRAGLTGPDAEVQAIRDRAKEEIDAAQRAHDALRGLTEQQRAVENVMLAERIANINKVRDADLERIQAARDAATKLSVDTTVRDTTAETEGIRAMMAAEMEGAQAVDAMRVALAGNEAVQRAANDAVARGTQLTGEQAAALRASAEEYERARIAAEKFQRVQQETASVVGGFLRDTVNGKNPLPGLGNYVKEQVLRGMEEAVAKPLAVKIAKVLGIEIPLSKQEQAAKDMNTAADKQLEAARIMAGGAPGAGSADGSVADASTVFAPVKPAWLQTWEKAMGIGGAAVGGYGTGYGIGQSTGSAVLGAAGGALAGAKLGAAFGPVGAAAGAVAGFVGGIIGAGDAAEAARKRLQALKEAFQITFDALKAELDHDTLGQAVAQVKAQYKSAREELEQTLSLGDAFSDPKGLTHYWEQYFNTLGDLTEMQKQRIQQLQEEAAAMERYFSESLDVRILRAQGKTKEADALEVQNRQEQERDEFRRTHNLTDDPTTSADDAEVARNLADYNKLIYAQSLELQNNTKALNELTTAVYGQPSGFKIEGYIQQYAKASPYPGQMTMPVNPFVPPTVPLSTPQLSQSAATSARTAPVTFGPGSIVVNESKTPQLTADAIGAKLATLLDQLNGSAPLGTPRASALDRIVRPNGIV